MPRQLTPDEQTQLDHLKSQLTTYQRNLRHLEGQADGHGGEKLAPIFVINQLEDTRSNIERIKREIAVLEGAPVTFSPPATASPSAESAPATRPRKLSPTQRIQLARLLLECQSIKSSGSRETIINMLDGIANNVVRDHAPFTEVLNLVNACLAHQNGLDDLLEILRAFEGESIPMRNVDVFLKSV
jgi:hypothetical protein